jgi:hypothetical protein
MSHRYSNTRTSPVLNDMHTPFRDNELAVWGWHGRHSPVLPADAARRLSVDLLQHPRELGTGPEDRRRHIDEYRGVLS